MFSVTVLMSCLTNRVYYLPYRWNWKWSIIVALIVWTDWLSYLICVMLELELLYFYRLHSPRYHRRSR